MEIKDLYVNFYTKSGIVKALNGVTFHIGKKETFGLVGESGCGKTVTASCILRLISFPPGKVESGSIVFTPGIGGLEAKLEELEAEEKRDEEEIGELRTRIKELKEKDAKIHETRNVIIQLEKEGTSPSLDEAKRRLTDLERDNNILEYSRAQLQAYRGKSVSMIFQEPMSALNPVFTAGAQISEVLLLHERAELAKGVLKQMEARLKEIDSYHFVTSEKTIKGENKCSDCGHLSVEEIETCPQCGGSYNRHPFRGIEAWRIRSNRRYYERMAKDPTSRFLRYSAKIPIVRRYQRYVRAEANARAERMLRLVRIPDPMNVMKSFPYELSGGMQQRVMIAMALACRPKLLIADEPTTALDVTVQAQILKLMRDLQLETGTSILLITHNLGVVAETCDRVGVMYAGIMAEVASTVDIFKNPLHPYTQGLMNLIPKVNVDIERLEAIEGTVPDLISPPSGCRFNPRCPYAMANCKVEKPELREVQPGHFVACHLYVGGS